MEEFTNRDTVRLCAMEVRVVRFLDLERVSLFEGGDGDLILWV